MEPIEPEEPIDPYLEAVMKTTPEDHAKFVDQVVIETVAEVQEIADADESLTIEEQIHMAAQLGANKALGIVPTNFELELEEGEDDGDSS